LKHWLPGVILMSVIFFSCFSPAFDIVLLNSSPEEVTSAHVSFDSFRSIGGVLIPHTQKVHGGVRRRVPHEAVFEWVDVNGHQHTVTVRIPSRNSDAHELVFEIMDDRQLRTYWR
jgi:hypothetical protein